MRKTRKNKNPPPPPPVLKEYYSPVMQLWSVYPLRSRLRFACGWRAQSGAVLLSVCAYVCVCCVCAVSLQQQRSVEMEEQKLGDWRMIWTHPAEVSSERHSAYC